MPPSLNPDNPPHLQLPPLTNIISRPTQPDDVPSVTDVCNALHYEKEAFVAHGVYYLLF